jgi:DNA-binding response OmpR family regulator
MPILNGVASVLIVEDDETIGASLSSSLSANGHDVQWQRTGISAVTAASGSSIDLVLLDLGLPDADGFDVCRRLRQSLAGSVIVVLTARRHEMDVVAALESGADDYLFKPFRTTELLARIRAHLRRVESSSPNAAPPLADGDLVLDRSRRLCLVAGTELPLRPKEFDLLAKLMESAGEAVTRDRLMREVWDEHWHGSTKTLDVHVAALRHRLGAASEATEPAASLPTITTLRGFGYRLDRA